MFFDLKNWKNKSKLEEFNSIKKEVIKFINLRKHKKKLYDFNFLYQDNQLLKKKISECHALYSDYEKIVLVGTGGSSLGSKAILEASLNNKVVFIENIDPNYVIDKIGKITEKKILLLLISKSGETTEVLSLYQTIINYFSKPFKLKNNILIITEKKNSTLYKICKKRNIKFVEHNSELGGRFSCFSETGLIPLKLAGLNSNYIKNLSDKTFNECINKNQYFFADTISSLFNIINKKKI